MSRPFLLQATRRAVCPISLRSQGLRYYAAHAAASHTVSPSREAGSPESSSAAGPSSVPLDAFSDAAVNGNKGSLKGSDGKRPRSKKIKKASREPREMPPRTSRTILDPFEDELRLTSLIAARPSPLTLSDIERYRVARKSRQEEPSYVEEYNQLVDALCRAFSKGQLTKFARMYGMKVGPKQKKIDIAEDIIEKQWQWPSLEEIEKQKRERTEVVEKLFTVDAPQLFHILGKDGADLLQLSMDYNVHVSLVSNPLALRVEGSPGSIKQLSRHIHSLKQSIISETVHLPSRTAIPREMLQQISRTVNAFIENIDLNGKVKVYARSTQALSAAMRFVVRTDLTALALRPRPLLSFLSQKLITSGPVMPFPQSYSFYPFLPPQSMSVGTNAAGSFRVRRVGQWLGPDYAESSSLQDRALSAGTGHTYDIHGDAAELKQTLFDGSSDKEPPQTVTATIGHILFASNVPKRHMSLTPPLQGQLPMSRILEWIATTHPKIQFIPSIPTSATSSASMGDRIMHRLVYRDTRTSESHSREASKVLMLEIQLSESPEPFPALHAESAINLEPEDSSGHIPESKSHQDRADQPGGSGDGWNISATLKHGSDSSVDLLLPDRPYDVQLSAMDVHSIAEIVWPQEIRDYYASLRSFFQSRKDPQLRPDAPLDFKYLDSKFVLDSNVSVRRSEDAVARPLEPTSSAAAQTTIVVTESVTDLESGQKTIRCEVQCTKPQSDRAWEDFLATCDRLTDDTNRKFHPHVSDYETNVL